MKGKKMYDIIKVNEKTYYLDNPSRIGIYTPNGENAYAIDSGNSATAAKKLLKAVDSLGLTLTAIFNTHSHADHTGGNALCQSRTGCRIYAPGREMYFTNTPSLEAVYLFGGYAPKKLLHTFFTAAPSEAEEVRADILPDGLEVIPLPGHSFDHVGYRTREGVVFLGDALVSEHTIEKYGITFNYDIAAAIDSLNKIKKLDGTFFIPCHSAPTADIAPLADKNIDTINSVIAFILDNLREPKSFDMFMRDAFRRFNIEMNDAQFALLGFTMRSYLIFCENSGIVSHYFADDLMMWKSL